MGRISAHFVLRLAHLFKSASSKVTLDSHILVRCTRASIVLDISISRETYQRSWLNKSIMGLDRESSEGAGGKGKLALGMRMFGGSVRNKAGHMKKWKKSGSGGLASDSSTCHSSVTDDMSVFSSSVSSLASTLSSIENKDSHNVIMLAMMPKAAKSQPISSQDRIVRRNNSNLPSRRRRPTFAEI